jgi:AraC-like DNA-binding protein/ligand-binding sensor protein
MARISFQDLTKLPVMREFYNLVWALFGIKVVLRSTDGTKREVIGTPPARLPFCSVLRDNPIGDSLCEECDRRHVKEARERSASLRYQCHAGLTEFIIPISLDTTIIAFLVSGQVLDHDPTESQWKKTKRVLEASGVDTSVLKKLYFEIPAISRSTQKDLIAQLELFANYVATTYNQLLLLQENRNDQIVARAMSFIQNNFSDPFYISDVARAAYTSERNLRRVFRAETGMTLIDHIQDLRTEKACELLLSTDKTCIQIAMESGFGGPQQFNLVFKKKRKVSPSEWRKTRSLISYPYS